MKFTPAEFLAFAKSAQSDEWATLKRASPFRYVVVNSGIKVDTGAPAPRNISNSEIVRFCQAYGTPEQAAVFKEIFNSSYLAAIASRYSVGRAEFRFPEEVDAADHLTEGATRLIQVNAYERNPEARRRCIEAHGTACAVCGFSFGEVYGDFARDFIHVHHLNPLATRKEAHEVDPARDLRPVCPNCHAVIHMRNGCLSIEEAKALLVERKGPEGP